MTAFEKLKEALAGHSLRPTYRRDIALLAFDAALEVCQNAADEGNNRADEAHDAIGRLRAEIAW